MPGNGIEALTGWGLLGNSWEAWGVAVAILCSVALTVLLLRNVLRRYFARTAPTTDNRFDDLLADVLGRTRGFFALALGVFAATFALELGAEAEATITTVVVIATVVQAGLWGAGFVRFGIDTFVQQQADPAVASATGILRVLGLVVVWSVVLLLVLSNLGIDVTAGIAGLGIGGVAVALAAQNILGDLFASLSIVLDRPFMVGDFIVVGDALGTVEHIGIKTTRVRSLSGEQLVFSNGDLLKSRIRNFKRMDERRVLFTFGVTYDTPRQKLEAIPRIAREVIEAQEKTRFDRAHFSRFGASSLDFEVVYFVLVPDYNTYMDIQQAINLELMARLEELGVEFAFPTQTLWVHTQPSQDVARTRETPSGSAR